MAPVIAALCTCSEKREALRIANALVEERLAACVNVLPEVASIYRWEGKVETANEVLLLIKTTPEGFPRLQDRIRELHSYDTPEIIALPIASGLEKYLDWVREQVSLPDR